LVFAILGEGYEKHLLKIDMKHCIFFIFFFQELFLTLVEIQLHILLFAK